jgi:peptidoglycan-associated lipoprotein
MARLRSVLVLAAIAALVSCGGPKRPPVLTTTPAGEAGTERPSDTSERLDPGPDLRALDGEFPAGEDFAYSDSPGGGGPLADIRFEFDRATLTDEARATLERHALWLQSRREVRLTIEGHCDERGTVEYNLALGEQRARAARDYLVSLGVAPERLRTVTYGKERPLDPSSTEQAWARTRRAHFVVAR